MSDINDYNLVYVRLLDGKEIRVRRITAGFFKYYDEETKLGIEIKKDSLAFKHKFMKNLKKKRAA